MYDIRCFWPRKHAFRKLICGAAIFRQAFLEFRFLYTSFHGPDLSKDVIDDLVILCKLVVGLAGNRWWLIIDGLLYLFRYLVFRVLLTSNLDKYVDFDVF